MKRISILVLVAVLMAAPALAQIQTMGGIEVGRQITTNSAPTWARSWLGVELLPWNSVIDGDTVTVGAIWGALTFIGPMDGRSQSEAGIGGDVYLAARLGNSDKWHGILSWGQSAGLKEGDPGNIYRLGVTRKVGPIMTGILMIECLQVGGDERHIWNLHGGVGIVDIVSKVAKPFK